MSEFDSQANRIPSGTREDDPRATHPMGFSIGAIFQEVVTLYRPWMHAPCPCSAIQSGDNGEAFHALDIGLDYHDGQQWHLIADFFAILHSTSFDNPSVPVRLIVNRAGTWRAIEVSRNDFDDSGWIAEKLGSEAAESVTDYQLLRRGIIYLGFSYSNCSGCRHAR